MLLPLVQSMLPSCFLLGCLIFVHTSHTFVGLQLVLIRRLDALNARGIYSETRHPTSQGVPGTETKASITIGRLVSKAENSFCPSSHAVVPRLGTFK